jgi:uncharacterized protein YgbK (DUF1537 family)
MAPLLGCIADDFTGATDLAGVLVANGMRTAMLLGLPQRDNDDGMDTDAVVVALKSRSVPPEEAVAASVAAAEWLRRAGCRRYYFKYCSTFDSTDRGNIGPVAEALMDTLGTDFTIACPAFPANRREVFNGYLFVDGVPLHESGMRNHPLNPMRDSSLVRVLQRQSKGKVGLVSHEAVRSGAESILKAFSARRTAGQSMAIVDAITDHDLRQIAAASFELRLTTGGSGLAAGLPDAFRAHGLLRENGGGGRLPSVTGHCAVIAGSCSSATQRQVEFMRTRGAQAFKIEPRRMANGDDVAGEVIAWASDRIGKEPVLIYATADADSLQSVQRDLGVERAGRLVENTLAEISKRLVERGVRRLIVAGGETSGAVLKALNVTRLQVGREIDPGVPWTVSYGDPQLALALKSGNFGADDFFVKAWEIEA